jgi:GNAT superfamily N-acetyltransferase
MSHLVYKLLPAEYTRYRTHLLALDTHSKFLRFGYQIKDEMINILCDKFEANPNAHKIFVIENDELEVVAVGHISLESNEVELAFSVLKQHQGQGMGSALMKRCIEWCQNRNIRTGCMVCLSSNRAVRSMARKHGILVNDHGETLADIHIPAPNSVSMINEAVDNNLSKFDHLGKLQRRFARMLTFPLHFNK